jgi:ABC-type xylose transport system permease subunit
MTEQTKTAVLPSSKKHQSIMNNPVMRNVLPVAGLAAIIVLFTILTGGKLTQPGNIQLLLSQTYVLMIAATGVFLVMTMGCLDFSQGSMLGISSIVVCYLSAYSVPLAILGGMATGAARCYQRILQCQAENPVVYCDHLHHVPVPRSVCLSDDQQSRLRRCKYLRLQYGSG